MNILSVMFGCCTSLALVIGVVQVNLYVPSPSIHVMEDTTCLSPQNFDLAFRYLQWKHATAKRQSPHAKVRFARGLEVEALPASASQESEIIFSQNGYKIVGFTAQECLPYIKSGVTASHQAWFCELLNRARRAGLPSDYLYRYIDGSNNEWFISPQEIRYIPITPERSSSGMYSGGEPFRHPLSAEQFAQISRLLSGVCTTLSSTETERSKGTAIVIKYVCEGVAVEDCLLVLGAPERVVIDDWLRQFKK